MSAAAPARRHLRQAAVEAYLEQLGASRRKRRAAWPKTESYLRRGLCGQERDGDGVADGDASVGASEK